MRRQYVYKNQGFSKVANRYYDNLLAINPLLATWLGEHQYDGILPEVGAEAIEKEIAFLRASKDNFEALGERELSIDERLDRDLVLMNLKRELFLLEDVRRWKLGRDLAMDIGNSLFILYVRDFAPLTQRVESMISRMKAAPMFLRSGRSLFQNVPMIWGEIFIESAERLPEFLDLIEKGISNKVPEVLLKDYRLASKELKKSLEQHVTWLKNAIMPKANGDWAMGTGAFQALLATRDLGINVSDMLELGDMKLRELKSRLSRMAQNLVGNNNIKEATYRIREKRPRTFDQVLSAYKDAVARSRAFVEMSKFATLPENETLEIVETPSYMAHLIPFAAYMSPERGTIPQKGIYMVTRPRKSADLGRHCYADISNTSVHEGYPGHHLQLCGQNLHPSKIRALADGIETIEGWAHYCEEEGKHRGFDDTEENRFIQVLDEVIRACRVLIDINIHQKTWTYQQAFEFLVTNTDMEEEAATAEMLRYTQTPGYPLSYLVGKHLIFELKNKLRKDFCEDFSDQNFHDLIIYEGGIPISLARKYFPEMMKQTLQKQNLQV